MDIQVGDLVTVALLVALEGLLSADNAMVLAVLVLGTVFFGAYKILSLPQLNRPPARRTEPPSERSDG